MSALHESAHALQEQTVNQLRLMHATLETLHTKATLQDESNSTTPRKRIKTEIAAWDRTAPRQVILRKWKARASQSELLRSRITSVSRFDCRDVSVASTVRFEQVDSAELHEESSHCQEGDSQPLKWSYQRSRPTPLAERPVNAQDLQ